MAYKYIYGTTGNDRMYGLNGYQNVIYAYGGNDFIDGGNLADFIYGRAGDDILFGKGGDDTLYGGADNDVFGADEGSDKQYGEAGNDRFVIYRGFDAISGGDGDDTIAFTMLDATSGAQVNLYNNLIYNDGYSYADTVSSIENITGGTAFADSFTGTHGANEIHGGAGDSIYGLDGDDRFTIRGAPQTISGGNGNDIAYFQSSKLVADTNGDGLAETVVATRGVLVDLWQARVLDDGFGGTGGIGGVENLSGTGFGDSLVGDGANNGLSGWGGADYLDGAAGNDYLDGGDGDDRLFGGAGDDTLSGGAGADQLYGGAGTDTLIGGAGDDLLRGESGIDSFWGDEGMDRVSLFHRDATQAAQVDLRIQRVLNDGYGNTELLNSVEGVGEGTQFADTFHGASGANQILGGYRDYLYGYEGDDSFQIGGAPGVLDGGAGTDSLSFSDFMLAADGDGDGLADIVDLLRGVSVDLGAGLIREDGFGHNGALTGIENVTGTDYADALTGDAGANRLEGLGGNDALSGGGGNDMLVGGAGRDTLIGGLGNDVLNGGGHGDTLTGGAGNDRFAFDTATAGKLGQPANLGTIADFARGDVIDLSAIDPVPGKPNDAFHFAPRNAFTGSAGELITVQTAGGTTIAGDVNGDRAADFTITLNDPAYLGADSFIL
jgi:Ca2+-binding RTX toxin-like protein